MTRKAEVTIKLTGAPGSGKTIILQKLRLYLEFFDIEAVAGTPDEHSLRLRFDKSALDRLREAR